jgi:hypothetical protein
MAIRVKTGASTWSNVTELRVKTALGTWSDVIKGRVKTAANVWSDFFTATITPSIASTVTISRNNATYPSTLTGTNFSWTNSTSLTYVFQASSDNINFTNITSATSIANPSSSSSNTVTYALTLSDFPAFTSYFRFVVTAVNSTYSTSATSTSSSVSVLQPAPINTVQPTITPSTGTEGVTEYSVNSNGTWDPVDTDGVYEYLWQSFDTPTYVSAPGTNNLSTYTPPSNFLALGYQSPIRCRVTATNASGSTSAVSSNTAAVVSANTVPGAPQNLQRTTGNGGSKTFTWSAPASDGGAAITSYQFNLNSSGWFTTSSSTSQSLTLAAGSNVFQVRAVNSVGGGTAASTGIFVVPTINSGPSASSITSSSATISWTSSNQESYSLSIPGAPSTPYGGSTATSRSITSLSSSTSYTPTLTITSSTGDTATTTGSAFTTTVSPPATPTITYSSVTFSSFTVSWSSSGATSYNVSVYESVSGASVFSASGTTATTVSPTGLKPNFSYSTTVTAINAGGTASNTVSQTTSLGPALTPTFGANSSTVGGFTGSVTNYDANYTFGIATSVGSVSFSSPSGSTRAFTVSGLSSGQSATVTVTTSRTGYSNGSAQTAGSATVVQYTVTWNAMGGTGGGSTTQNAGVAHTAPSPGTRTGFTFNAYYDTPSFDFTYGPIASGGSFTPPSSITMYARWTAVANTVPGTVNSLTATSSLSGTNLNWSASWSAPSSDGGSAITGYRIYVERAGSSSGPWLATTTQSPAGTGAFTQASPRLVSSATTSVSGRVTGTSATWIRVWVAAVNSVGTGSYTSAVG